MLVGALAAPPAGRAQNAAGEELTLAERFDLLGVQHMDAKDYPAAVEAFLQALDADPSLTLASKHLALAYTEMGRDDPRYFARADSIYQSLVVVLPVNDVEMLRGRAYLRALSGDYDGAVEDYQLILAEQPRDCDALVKLYQVRSTQSEVVIEAIGLATPELQKYATEMADAQMQLLELCPEMVTDYQSLFNTFTRSRRYAEGAATFETLLALHPDDPELLRHTGDLYFMSRNWAEAARLFGELLEMEPENQEYRLKYISSLRKIEKFQEADQELQKYIEIRDAQADSTGK